MYGAPADLGVKFGVKFGRPELSIPPFEISRRELQDGHDFSISWPLWALKCAQTRDIAEGEVQTHP